MAIVPVHSLKYGFIGQYMKYICEIEVSVKFQSHYNSHLMLLNGLGDTLLERNKFSGCNIVVLL